VAAFDRLEVVQAAPGERLACNVAHALIAYGVRSRHDTITILMAGKALTDLRGVEAQEAMLSGRTPDARPASAILEAVKA
jgi:hypothetical protein